MNVFNPKISQSLHSEKNAVEGSQKIPAVRMGYAVMEKSSGIKMVKGEFNGPALRLF